MVIDYIYIFTCKIKYTIRMVVAIAVGSFVSIYSSSQPVHNVICEAH